MSAGRYARVDALKCMLYSLSTHKVYHGLKLIDSNIETLAYLKAVSPHIKRTRKALAKLLYSYLGKTIS